MTELQVPIRIKRGVGGPPSSLLRGELAYYEGANRLYIGSGDSGATDAGGRPIATTVEELLAPAQFLSALADVVLASGPNDGDVLTWSVADDAWIAQALSIAWADVTGKPSVFTPDTHTHAWGDITSGVPSTFAPSTHASSHATGGADAITPSNIGAAAASHTHDAATTSVAGFMSSSDKTKLDGIATGAEVNVNADWNASSGDAQILNKPTLGTAAAAATTDFIAASAASAFGLTLIDDADASAARTTLGLGSAATSASGDFAAASHSHAWGDITSGVPSTFTPASHTHGNISNDGKIGSTAGLVVQTGASGALSTLSAGTSGQVLTQGASGLEWGTAGGVGTVTSITAGTGLTGGTFTDSGTIAVDFASTETAGKVVEANDARLSDTRTPTDNTVATAKIQDGAVTYAKIQDVSGTDKILGRATAGAGDVEEITCTAAGRALLDDADAAAQRTTLGLGTAATSASTDFFAASAVSAFGENLISEENAAAARTTLGLGGASEKAVDFYAEASHAHGNITTAGAIGSTSGLPVKTGASGVLEAGAFGTSAGEFAEGNHTHAWTDITSKPSDFTPSAHNHTVTLEISGFIEVPEAKTYVLSPSIPAAITITNVKAKTGSGTCDIKLQDDGSDIANTTINDVGTSVAEPATEPSATVAAGSVLTLVVSDLSSGAPEDLAFSVHYTVASQNNA